MKLKEYFNEVRNMKLSESQKMVIFENFVKKSYKQNFLKRWSFYVKVGVYTIIIIFFIYSFFPIFLYQTPKNENNFVVTKIKPITGGVYVATNLHNEDHNEVNSIKQVFAKDLGKILYVKGDFRIVRGDKSLQTKELLDGDYVVLSRGTDLKFKLNNGLYGKINGPAKFQIKYISGQKIYVINLLEGEYSQFSAKTFSGEVKVKSSDLIIMPLVNKNVNIKIVKKKKKEIIENIGKTPIVLEKISKKIKKTVKSNEVAKVNGDIKVYKIIQDIKNKNIKSETKFSTGIDINILNEDTKLVPTIDQVKFLSQILYSKFLEKNILNLINYYKKDGEKIAIKNIMYRILEIYKKFDLKIDSTILRAKAKSGKYDIDDLFLILDQLISKLQNNYYLEPKFILKLKKIEVWILILKKGVIKTGGKYSSLEEVLERNNLIKFKDKLLFK